MSFKQSKLADNFGAGWEAVIQLPLFKDIDLDNFEEKFLDSNVLSLMQDEILINAGEQNLSLFVVLSGRLSLHLQSPQAPAFKLLGPGECVGEMSLIEQQATTAYVVADEDSQILEISSELFWELINISKGLARNLLDVLSGRLRDSDKVLATEQLEKRQHYLDVLTHLYNRDWLVDTLGVALEQDDVSLILLELDGFRRFSKEFGRDVANQVQQEVAHLLLNVCDFPSTGSHVGVARINVGRFAVLFTGVEPQPLVDEVRRAVANMVVPETKVILQADQKLPKFTISVGVISGKKTTGDEPDNARELFEVAGVALRKALFDGDCSVVMEL